jgi:hypothetical protein
VNKEAAVEAHMRKWRGLCPNWSESTFERPVSSSEHVEERGEKDLFFGQEALVHQSVWPCKLSCLQPKMLPPQAHFERDYGESKTVPVIAQLRHIIYTYGGITAMITASSCMP